MKQVCRLTFVIRSNAKFILQRYSRICGSTDLILFYLPGRCLISRSAGNGAKLGFWKANSLLFSLLHHCTKVKGTLQAFLSSSNGRYILHIAYLNESKTVKSDIPKHLNVATCTRNTTLLPIINFTNAHIYRKFTSSFSGCAYISQIYKFIF